MLYLVLASDLYFFFFVFPRKAWDLNQEEVLGGLGKEELILLRLHSNEEDVVWALELKALTTKILHGKRKKRYIFYCVLFFSSFILDKVIIIKINERSTGEFSQLPVNNNESVLF